MSDWISDHRAVVSTLRVKPVAPPNLVAVDSFRVPTGSAVGVTFRAPARDDYRLSNGRGVRWAPRDQHFGP